MNAAVNIICYRQKVNSIFRRREVFLSYLLSHSWVNNSSKIFKLHINIFYGYISIY